MKIVAIVQARMGSTRLPNKVMKCIEGVPIIELLLNRLSQSKELHQIIVATSTDPKNSPLAEHIKLLGYSCERGSEDDVLERYVNAAIVHQADVIVRITGDCPLIDPELVDECIRRFRSEHVDYFNITKYPIGLDIEVVSLAALEQAMRESDKPYDHEHVTSYIYESNCFNTSGMQNNEDLSELRWTVDELADFEVIKNVFMHFAPDINFSWQQVLDLQINQQGLFVANEKITQKSKRLDDRK